MNKVSLLSQLQIDRDAGPGSGGGVPPRVWWIAGAVLAVILVVALVAFIVIAQPGRVPVSAATATVASSGGAAQGASLLDASGYVVARRQATVSAKVTGKVTEVLIEEGQHVTAGQVLARLDNTNVRASLAQAGAQVLTAESSLRVAEVAAAEAGPKYERNRAIHARGFLSDQEVEDARAAFDTSRANLELAQRQLSVAKAGLEVARRAVDDTVVTAPFSGVVTVKAAQPGEIVSPISAGGGFTRTGICTIVDMDSLEVQVDVAESFINKVVQGMPATVKLNAYPDWNIPAEVLAVIPTADRSKATVSVRVSFKTRDPRIVPEMGARVSFLAPAQPSDAKAAPGRSVLVPADAVQTDGDQPVIYVINGHKVERRAVRLGAKSEAGQVVLAGISSGEEVAVGGQGKLKDGAAVRIIKPKS
jgi:RND family efflux transporter MFP subunit